MTVRRIGAFATLLLSLAGPVAAQLRPYEPAEWEVFLGDRQLVGSLGAAWLGGQRASLAGTRGNLLELGNLAFTARSGRIAITAEGTTYRQLDPGQVLAPPAGGARQTSDRSGDVGDFRIATLVRLTPAGSPATALLRFGTRLPTTDNRVGLERDQTDFFATLAAATGGAGLRATAELGVGIHGTRDPEFEQSDVLIFLLGLGLRDFWGEPTVLLLGHADGLPDRAIRGNEELAELRLRVRTPGPQWLQLEGIFGLATFSPEWGISVTMGIRR